MQKSYRDICGLVVAIIMVAFLPCVATAQTSSVSAYSPYSMYGPGELLTPGTAQMRAMGGVGIALRSMGQVNLMNPASASIAPRKSFLFDFGFDGTHFRNSQPKYDATGAISKRAKTVYNTINIHNIALAFPIAKGLGMSFGLSPYSSVGYKMKLPDYDKNNTADIGRVMYGYLGDGDITEVKLSIGWEPWRNFSIGVAAKYYWGHIERNYTTEVVNMITGAGTYSSTIGVDKYNVNNFKFQAGLQWNIILTETHLFTVGATYDLGGKLNPKRESYVYTDNIIHSINNVPIRDRIEALELRVPHQVGVGLFYRDRRIAWGADYNFAAWGDNNKSFDENGGSSIPVNYTNTHTIKVGFEITPHANDVRSYFNRISYRLGARVGNYYQTFAGERVNQLAVTAGFGLPVKIWGASSINIGFEYGRMAAPKAVQFGGETIGLITQNYYKVSVGFSLFSADTSDYWFVRQKYD